MDEYIRKQDVLNLPQSTERNLRGEIVERSIDVKDIEALEPADVALVVHSQWKYKCGEVQCPECGNRIHRIDLSGFLNFCPNCGVKMDGGKK